MLVLIPAVRQDAGAENKPADDKAVNVKPSFAFYLSGTQSTQLDPAEGQVSVIDLPDDLVIHPGIYRAHDKVYKLEREGLYRFICPGQDNQQRIVYRKNAAALISALCWIHSHGSRDDSKGFEELTARAAKEKLIMTCGPYANFAQRLFQQLNVKSRLAGSKILDERNGYDDGHVLIEVYLDGKWALCDIDQHVFFMRRGERLSLLDLSMSIPAGDYKLERLAASISLAVSDFKENSYDYGLWMETKIFSEASLRSWYDRVMRVPVLADNSGTYCTGIEKNKLQINKLWPDLKFIPVEEFRRRFYE